MQSYAVIVAGGSGTRMGSSLPKQFLEIQGRPLFIYSVEAFLNAFPDIQVILVMPRDYMLNAAAVVDQLLPGGNITLTVGGDTRFQSVRNGLDMLEGEGIVFVHDAVRCLVSVSLIHRCYAEAIESGSAIPVVPVRDSIREITDTGSCNMDRSRLRAIQTPQAFRTQIILPAFELPYQSNFTDEASVVEAFGQPVTLVEGEETNIKVTYPLDLVLAEQVLKSRA